MINTIECFCEVSFYNISHDLLLIAMRRSSIRIDKLVTQDLPGINPCWLADMALET